MRRILLLASICIVAIIMTVCCYYYIHRWRHIATVSFIYNPKMPRPLIVEATIKDQPMYLVLSLGDTYTALNEKTFHTLNLSVEEQQSEQVNVGLGSYQQAQKFYFDRYYSVPGQPGISGILGAEFFASKGARLTLDFVTKTLIIDSQPDRPRLVPPYGTVQLPLNQSEIVAEYEIPVKVKAKNQLIASNMKLDTENEGIHIPDSYVRAFLAEQILAKRNFPSLKHKLKVVDTLQRGPHALPIPATWYQGYPINLQMDNQNISVTAYNAPMLAMPGFSLAVLSQYRVVIDYRDKMLYLEPPH